MSSMAPFEKRLLALETRYRRLRLITGILAAISVALCGLVGYMIGGSRNPGQPGGLGAVNGATALEVNQLLIKSSLGEERVRLDPGGLTIFGDQGNREQLRLEFSGLRFFNAAGESAHFNSQELSLADGDTGLRCSLDSRFLSCADEKSGGLSASFGILAPPKGETTTKPSELSARMMTRAPHLSLTNLKDTTSIDLIMLPSPSISIINQATGKTVIAGPAPRTASGFQGAEASAITLVDKAGRTLWKAP